MPNEPSLDETRAYLEKTLLDISLTRPEYSLEVRNYFHLVFGNRVNGHSLAHVVTNEIIEQSKRRGLSPKKFIDYLANSENPSDWSAQISGALISQPQKYSNSSSHFFN